MQELDWRELRHNHWVAPSRAVPNALWIIRRRGTRYRLGESTRMLVDGISPLARSFLSLPDAKRFCRMRDRLLQHTAPTWRPTLLLRKAAGDSYSADRIAGKVMLRKLGDEIGIRLRGGLLAVPDLGRLTAKAIDRGMPVVVASDAMMGERTELSA